MKGKRIVLVSSSSWVGTEVESDVTEWFENSGCKTLEKFEQENGSDLWQEAVELQGVEYHLKEEDEES